MPRPAMKELKTEGPIERSRPHYRRSLLIATVVFSGPLCANLFIFGHLAFLDLGHRMRKEVVSRAKERAIEIAKKLSEDGEVNLFRLHSTRYVTSKYLEGALLGERYVTTVTLYDPL